MVTSVKVFILAKAFSPIYVKLDGNSILDSDVPSKADIPILFRVLGKITSFNFELFLKALLSITVIPSGISIREAPLAFNSSK